MVGSETSLLPVCRSRNPISAFKFEAECENGAVAAGSTKNLVRGKWLSVALALLASGALVAAQQADWPVFQIKPLKPVEELRREALRQHPPLESGYHRNSDLVDVTALDPTIRLDIRYATNRNFLGTPLYTEARALLQRPAAEALVRASRALHAQGYGLLVYDAYRPWYVTRMFWDGTPDDKKNFVANPSQGSRHNRGCAVDLTLYSLATGKPVVMTGGYDEMSERSYPNYPGGTALQRANRDLLRKVMESEGFSVFQYEWWHFDYKDWQAYPILNKTFEELDQQGK
jgi:D-alanyl-D-alanine dipeptidase